MGTNRDCGNHGDPCSQSETDHTEAIAELDAVSLPPRSKDLIVATGVVNQNPPTPKYGLRLGRRGLDRASSGHHGTHPWKPEEEGVEQRINGLVFTSLAPPRGQQDG